MPDPQLEATAAALDAVDKALESDVSTAYSLCRTFGGLRRHIRPLIEGNRKVTPGSTDTLTLCGQTPTWDVTCPITTEALTRWDSCMVCSRAYKAATEKAPEPPPARRTAAELHKEMDLVSNDQQMTLLQAELRELMKGG